MTELLSILMPVYNEGESLARSFNILREYFQERCQEFELIVVDDASTDDTPSVIRELVEQHAQVTTLRHATNQGPCSGLKTGPALARGEWLMLLPVDLAIPLDDIHRLFERRMEADILLGYMTHPGMRSRARQIQSAVYTWLINHMFGMDLRQVNYVALYRTEIFRHIKLVTSGVALHAEILLRAREAGFRLEQVGLGYQPRHEGVASGGKPSVILKTLSEILKLRTHKF